MADKRIAYIAFAIFALLWLGFALALALSPGIVDSLWQVFLGWPLLVKILFVLLFLPVVLGLWVWESTWPLWLRLLLVAGLAWVNIYLFFPRKTASPGEARPAE